jgi:hypothetical protein
MNKLSSGFTIGKPKLVSIKNLVVLNLSLFEAKTFKITLSLFLCAVTEKFSILLKVDFFCGTSDKDFSIE